MNYTKLALREAAGTTRRDFLRNGTAAALVIGVAVPTGTGRALAAAGASAGPATAGTFAPNVFLRITSDGRITVVSSPVEMGQGVLTAVPMLVAEELDADWSHVHVEQAPTDPAFNNPMFGMQATGGSTTVRAWWGPLRKAGAAARTMLVGAAAQKWQLDATTLRTEASHVIAPDGRRLSYGSLVAAAAALPVPADPPLKNPKDFRLLGKPLKRLDTPDKVNGKANFSLDAPRLPGMLVAVMARAPLPGAKPAKVKDDEARAVKGVRQVLTIPSGVAVLADGYWAAKKGRDLLQIEWDLGPHAGLSSEKVTAMLTDGADNATAVARTSGDVNSPAAAGLTRVEALYEAPYLAHACMEPLNATAWVQGDEVELWVGSQSQGPTQGILSQVAQVAPGKVKLHPMMLGGGFGRRFAPDFTIDATLLSKLSGKPVKLVYSREDDMAAGYFRPASVARLTAALDANGRPTMFKAGIGCPSITEASGFMHLGADGVDAQAVEGLADHPYDVEHQRIAYGRREPGPQVWFWRSVGHSQNFFFMEGFIDELATAAKQDPYEFRRGLLSKSPRCKGVLEAVAEKAGWGKPLPTGIHRGIAVGESFGTYVAEVAEVSVNPQGEPKVHRIVAAVDCGMIVNPEIIRRQIEGAIVYGLSAALHGRISFKDGRVEQGNFDDYPVLRMNEMPKIEVHIVPSTEAPGGIGEPGTPPAAPAVVNAIFAATGKRIRKLPIDPSLLKKA